MARPPQFFKFEHYLHAGSYGWLQILVQAKEDRTRTRRGIELLIQEWYKLISNLSIAEKLIYLPPVHATEDEVPEHPEMGRAMLLMTGVENTKIASGGLSAGIEQ